MRLTLGLHAPFGRDFVGHEPEVGAGAIAELRRHADALEPAHDPVAGPDLAQLAADRAPVGQDHDSVHALALDDHPLPLDPHLRPLVRGGIEVVRHAAVLVGHPHRRVLHVRHVTAERKQLLEQVVERGRTRGLHLERQPRELVVGAAQLEVQDLECPPALDHLVENRLELLGVDEVPLGGDDGGMGRWVGHDERPGCQLVPLDGGA